MRAAGAVPATVGILDGKLVVGLDEAELRRFGEAGAAARKAGARDLAACCVQGASEPRPSAARSPPCGRSASR